MKVVLALFVLVGCTLAHPQYSRINAPDFVRDVYQDASGQLSQSFSTGYIQQTDSLRLIPNGQGDYVPVQRTVSQYTAPSGERVNTVIDAGPQGAIITGSHVPRA